MLIVICKNKSKSLFDEPFSWTVELFSCNVIFYRILVFIITILGKPDTEQLSLKYNNQALHSECDLLPQGDRVRTLSINYNKIYGDQIDNIRWIRSEIDLVSQGQ